MTISGFTMVRNATRYYYPVKESILSILPIVDEFIVALGEGDIGDKTRELIESINSPKIKIIDRVWDPQLFLNSEIFRHETNIALNECKGDWCFYIQADEVVHEKDLEAIRISCEKYLNNKKIEGLLFDYYHFWGDYNHYLPYHGWYKNEIRIVRNNIGIESIKDAQSFRLNGQKLNVAKIPAHIYHYGWVRPPELMLSKKNEHDRIHRGGKLPNKPGLGTEYYDYGNLSKIKTFKGSHPEIMKNRMKEIGWKEKLRYEGGLPQRKLNKHEKLKYRIISYIENKILCGKQIGGYKNWTIVK